MFVVGFNQLHSLLVHIYTVQMNNSQRKINQLTRAIDQIRLITINDQSPQALIG